MKSRVVTIILALLIAFGGLLLPFQQASAVIYGGVDFPLGDKSFADQVVSFSPGTNTATPYNNPQSTIGPPDASQGKGHYVALGHGGILTVKFTDNYLIDVDGPDLYVFEIGGAVEPFKVEISKNGSSWISLGTVRGQPTSLDIHAKVNAGDKFSYVRVADGKAGMSSHPYAGADIDAIGAIGAEEKENQDPICSFNFEPAYPTPQDTIHVTSTSYDPDGDHLSYEWYIDGEYLSGVGDSDNWYWRNPDPGTYTITLVLDDGRGGEAECSEIIEVGGGYNQDPICSFNFEPPSPTPQDTMYFTSTSYDPDGDHLSYEWYIDGEYLSGVGDSDSCYWHNPDPGTYTITLVLDDGRGGEAECSEIIEVGGVGGYNQDPICSFSFEPTKPTSQDTVVFTSTSHDTDGDQLSYSWYVDGQYKANSKSWSWAEPSSDAHTIKLIVKDGKGGSAECSQKITVTLCPHVMLEHIYCAATQLAWARKDIHYGAPRSDIIAALSIAKDHARLSGFPFEHYEAAINNMIGMLNRGASMPEVAAVFDASANFRLQLVGKTCKMSAGGQSVMLEHIYCAATQLAWARKDIHYGAPRSDIIAALSIAKDHARLSGFPFEHYEAVIDNLISMLNRGASMPEVAAVFDASANFLLQLEGKTCKIGVGQPPPGGAGLLVVTSKDRLKAKFGASGYEQIENAIMALNGRILDVSSNDYGEIDRQVEAVGRANISTILIVGGHDIVPFSTLPNPTKDGDILYTDDVYGDFDHDANTIIDLPIARIPDGGDLNLVLTQLGDSVSPISAGFALANSARPWANKIADIFGSNTLWSLPALHSHIPLNDVQARNDYFMLHGGKNDTSIWWGCEPTYPEAFKVYLADSRGVILTGACYGAYVINKNPSNSICLSFLKSGSTCFVGSTGINYSGKRGAGLTHYGGLFHNLFFTELSTGTAPMQAFYETKREYAAKAVFPPEKKLMHAYVYYGRP